MGRRSPAAGVRGPLPHAPGLLREGKVGLSTSLSWLGDPGWPQRDVVGPGEEGNAALAPVISRLHTEIWGPTLTCGLSSPHPNQGYQWLKDKILSEEGRRQQAKLKELQAIAERLGCTLPQLAIGNGLGRGPASR